MGLQKWSRKLSDTWVWTLTLPASLSPWWQLEHSVESYFPNSNWYQVSLASHTLRRERKGLVTLQLPSCRRGTQLSNIAVSDNKMLTSAKHVVTYCTPWQRMRSTKSADLIGHSKILSWGQLDGCSVTRPFLSLRRVWLARLVSGNLQRGKSTVIHYDCK